MYTFMFCQKNADRLVTKAVNTPNENVSRLKYSGTAQTDQNCTHEVQPNYI
jgi:hypothetical protein